jgi:dihydrofolate synthase/folylpolyglutamate synthase
MHAADPRRAPAGLTAAEAERWLLDLELFGMTFGLERMRRLLTVLGSPQDRFRSVHVVGSNGKSSTARMTAAILHAHGLRTGAYLSPHLVSFTERIRIDGHDLADADFAAAAARVVRAAAAVDRTLPGEERVTQFEAITAIAYDELARRDVDVAVVEAGLGGRYDATNVVPSEVQVLTSVSLEHTRWLGSTISAIAEEKLDVVQPGGTLVVGAGLHADALEVAERICAERAARLLHAPVDPGVPVLAAGAFQRRNFAAAATAAAALLGTLDERAVRDAAAGTLVPGRFEVVAQRPLTILDGAHNADGMRNLVGALRDAVGSRRLVAVLSVLDDKDASAMLAEIAPLCARLVCTRAANPRALPPATLASLARQHGDIPELSVVHEPRAALAAARAAAGPGGAVVVTGSLYLLADLLRPAGARGSAL